MLAAVRLVEMVRPVLDYALPPRCPVCGEIVSDQGSFCAACWLGLDFLDEPLCAACGEPLAQVSAMDARCAPCLADPPPFDRARAVTAYGDAARTLSHRLKYGRRTGHARVMAAHMARLLPSSTTAQPLLLVPVPLHRWRIWSRGFNQAALIATQIARKSGAETALDALRRTRRTPPLHKMGRRARAKTVRNAFALAPGAGDVLSGRHVILIDDIWTTGATAASCARVLAGAGAARVEILCWSRALLSGSEGGLAD